jgi:glycosyltransferase involved in cell wall biosynthesis
LRIRRFGLQQVERVYNVSKDNIRIGIVTPSYNQAQFIEQTIDSVLSQGYPYLEYVVIDGGSTDGSVDIIRRYEKYLTFWKSERDSGQSEAINKGLRALNSDVWAYLNSDDIYLPGTFSKVAAEFEDSSVLWVTGAAHYVDESGASLRRLTPVQNWNIEEVLERIIHQPVIMAVQVSNFMRSTILQKFGYFDESLHYCMDVDYGLRLLLEGIRPRVLDDVLAHARLHSASKTMNQAETNAFACETAHVLEYRCKREMLNTSQRKAVNKALLEFRKQSALDVVRQSWINHGRRSGLQSFLAAVTEAPNLVLHRPALGLFRRIIIGDAVTDSKTPSG